MAEGLFRAAAKDEPEIEVLGSAGVAAFDGDLISPETADILNAKQTAMDTSAFRSRLLNRELLKEATHVFAMTGNHLSLIVTAFPEFEKKCSMFCDFVEIDGCVGADVPDPIGRGQSAYEQVAVTMEAAIPGLIGYLKSESE